MVALQVQPSAASVFFLGTRKISVTEFQTLVLEIMFGEGPSHAWLLGRLLTRNTKISGTGGTGNDLWGRELVRGIQ